MIKISVTFGETTPESREQGEYSNSGFLQQEQEYTFRDLVEKLQECSTASQHPIDASTAVASVWFSTEPETIDYVSGTERYHSVHFAGTQHQRRYWIMAARAAGLL